MNTEMDYENSQRMLKSQNTRELLKQVTLIINKENEKRVNTRQRFSDFLNQNDENSRRLVNSEQKVRKKKALESPYSASWNQPIIKKRSTYENQKKKGERKAIRRRSKMDKLDQFLSNQNESQIHEQIFHRFADPSIIKAEVCNELVDNSPQKNKHKLPKSKQSSDDIIKIVQTRHKTRIREALNIDACVILPEDSFTNFWGAIVLVLLMYATLITPYRIAFIERDTLGWIIVDAVVDLFFLIDLVLNLFFFAYYDLDEELIFDRKKIMKRYLKSWFIVDFIAIIPFNRFYGNHYNSLSRLARLPRLYRLLKITRIVKTLRVCKEKNKWIEYAPSLSAAGERLLAFVLVILILIHVAACLWLEKIIQIQLAMIAFFPTLSEFHIYILTYRFIVGKIDGIHPDTWIVRYSYQDSSNFEIYTVCFYFIISTITSVGYGDISPSTVSERWFTVMIMVLGVMSYSFMISSLSSLFTSKDIRQTNKNTALDSLRRIDISHNLDTGLFLKLKKTIIKKFKEVEYIKNRDSLMHLLPRKLQGDLNSAMHESLVRKIDIFMNEDAEFVEYMARVLKPKKYSADDIICKEGSKNYEIYIGLKYVLPEFNDIPYKALKKGERFGDLEIVHLFLQEKQLNQGGGIFTVRAKQDSEILVLSQTDLLILHHKFKKQIESIFEGAEFRFQHTLELKTKIEQGLKKRVSGMNKVVQRISTHVERADKLKTGYTREIKSENELSEQEDSDSIYSDMSDDISDMSEYMNNLDLQSIQEMKRESSKKTPSAKHSSKSINKIIAQQNKGITPRSRIISSKDYRIQALKKLGSSFRIRPTRINKEINITGTSKRENLDCCIFSENISHSENDEIRSLGLNVDENIETLQIPASCAKIHNHNKRTQPVDVEEKEEIKDQLICTD